MPSPLSSSLSGRQTYKYTIKWKEKGKTNEKQEKWRHVFVFGTSLMSFYDQGSLRQKYSGPQGMWWLQKSTWQRHGWKTVSAVFRVGLSKDVSGLPKVQNNVLSWQSHNHMYSKVSPVRPLAALLVEKEAALDRAVNAFYSKGIRSLPGGASSLPPMTGEHGHHLQTSQSLTLGFFFKPFLKNFSW